MAALPLAEEGLAVRRIGTKTAARVNSRAALLWGYRPPGKPASAMEEASRAREARAGEHARRHERADGTALAVDPPPIPDAAFDDRADLIATDRFARILRVADDPHASVRADVAHAVKDERAGIALKKKNVPSPDGPRVRRDERDPVASAH